MEKRKSVVLNALSIIIIAVLLMLASSVVVGCSPSSKINNNVIGTPKESLSNIQIEWDIPTTMKKVEGTDNEYYNTYQGTNLVEGLSISTVMPGIEFGYDVVSNTLDRYVSGAVDADIYTIVANYKYADGSIGGLSQTLIFTIYPAEVTSVWTYYYGDNTADANVVEGNEFISGLDLEYSGQTINFNVKYQFGGEWFDGEVDSMQGVLKNAKTYTLSAIFEANTNINIANTSLTVRVNPKDMEYGWSYYYGDSVANKTAVTTLDFTNGIDLIYNAQQIHIDIELEFNNTIYNNLTISITKNGNSIDKIKDVGEYRITAINNDNNINDASLQNKTLIINITPKNIYIIPRSYSIYYGDMILANVGCDIYAEYNMEDGTGVLLEDSWPEEIVASTQYYLADEPVTVANIKQIINNWEYSVENDSKSFNIKVNTFNDTNYYVVDTKTGELVINLGVLEIKLYKNGVLQQTKNCHQAEVVNITNWLSGFGDIEDTITNWYIDGVEKTGNYKFTQSINEKVALHTYTIYNVYYMSDVADNTPSVINDVIKFHKYSPITLPHNTHYDEAPTKYAYYLKGWAYDGDVYTSSSTFTTNNANVNNDIYLYPVFAPNVYHVYVETWLRDNEDGEGEILKSIPLHTYTIEDYDSDKTFTMNTHSEIEGYLFKGWYYANVQGKENQIKDNAFKVSDFITREQIEGLGDISIKGYYDLIKCTITLLVGDKTILTETIEPGSKINKDYYFDQIERKFGFIYILSEVPEKANVSVIVIRVTEVPFLWIMLGVLIVGGITTIYIVKAVKRRKHQVDKNKLDVILNRFDN